MDLETFANVFVNEDAINEKVCRIRCAQTCEN